MKVNGNVILDALDAERKNFFKKFSGVLENAFTYQGSLVNLHKINSLWIFGVTIRKDTVSSDKKVEKIWSKSHE